MDKIIDYYFSPSSPWTYLGHARLAALASKNGARINVKPMDLAEGVFPVSGGLPLSKRPKQRIAYRSVELKRWSDYLAIPLNLAPRFFPVASDLASRAIVAADLEHGPDKALDFAGRVMRGVWAEQANIAEPETLKRIAAASGLEGDALLASAEKDEVKARYAGYTREAIERQVFGAPFYVYCDEPFWGQDRLEFLERALKAE
jgi:2-hydroxychromene-2-carboxylate isomerase